MKLEQSFDVAAPIERVWSALIDVERVAPCLPGANVTGRNEDGSFAGNLTIKIGPTTAAYAGRLEMDRIDESAHTATMQAQGTDKRGQGGAKATITSTLSSTADGTHVEVSTDYHITGRLARFGRGGMIEDISNRLLREFASCLQKSLAREPAPGGTADGEEPAPRGAAEAGEPAPEAAAQTEPAAPAPTEAADAETVASAAGAEREPAAATPPPSAADQQLEASNAIEGIPLLASVLWERTRRNPLPIAVVFGFLMALLVLRRRRD